MNITATGGAEADAPSDVSHGHAHGPLHKLALGAVGIVYGDIGTSPIYAFRETFAGHHTLAPDQLHIYGVLSLIFWSMMIIVTTKYISVIMRADNKGEGGSLALLALISRKQERRLVDYDDLLLYWHAMMSEPHAMAVWPDSRSSRAPSPPTCSPGATRG